MPPDEQETRRVVIVGGGLAGLAAATALATRGFAVTLLESRPRWGGRASSFVDRATGEAIDNCQHVALGCCTNFLYFCRTVGIDRFFHRETHLTFVEPAGRRSDFRASWLPAPLHLFPSFSRLKYLTWGEKWRLAMGLKSLAYVDPATYGDESFRHWLERHRQPAAVIERFWHVVLVSALSETLDRIDVGHARKVFVDSFLRNRHGWEVWLPIAPLDALYGTVVEGWLAGKGVTCRLGSGVTEVSTQASGGGARSHAGDPGSRAEHSVLSTQYSGGGAGRSPSLEEPPRDNARPERRAHGTVVEIDSEGPMRVVLRSGERIEAEDVILAVPQNLLLDLLPEEWRTIPMMAGVERLETAPISSVHLWFDREITSQRHATFVGGLTQWMFNRSEIQRSRTAECTLPGTESPPTGTVDSVPSPGYSASDTEHSALNSASAAPGGHYYQVVISASRDVVGRPHDEVIRAVLDELQAIWPAAREAELRHARLVTEHKAVVSMQPGVDRWRPTQQTPIANLHLAGDWTQTGWPGTMEGAVRSGYLAAESILRRHGRFEPLVQPDLPTACLSRWLLGL